MENQEIEDFTNFLVANFTDEPYEGAVNGLRGSFLENESFAKHTEAIFQPFIEGKIPAKKVFDIVFNEADIFVHNENDAVSFIQKLYSDLFE